MTIKRNPMVAGRIKPGFVTAGRINVVKAVAKELKAGGVPLETRRLMISGLGPEMALEIGTRRAEAVRFVENALNPKHEERITRDYFEKDQLAKQLRGILAKASQELGEAEARRGLKGVAVSILSHSKNRREAFKNLAKLQDLVTKYKSWRITFSLLRAAF